MKTHSLLLLLILCLAASCTRQHDISYASVPAIQNAKPILDTAPLCGSCKGRMAAGKTYTVGAGCNIVVNAGDTLYMEHGVHLYMSPSSSVIVKGVFISLGTAADPNWITVQGMEKTDNPSISPDHDSAYTATRLWCGINCDTNCRLLVIKWTHIEYSGNNFIGTPPLPSLNQKSHTLHFQNPNGYFILEDSWLYGSIDEVRVVCGRICFMRNTMEKFGFAGAEGFDVKHGTVGDMAYNLLVGVASAATKASDAGIYDGPQTNVTMYNNTYVNCGYRRAAAGHGGSINFEEGARGLAYNNLIVNCKYGLRIVNNPLADTANIRYGNTYNYGDSLSIVNQFYPQSYITIPQATDIPTPASFLPATYKPGDIYNAPQLVSANNPLFVAFPLPASEGVANVAYASGFNFRLLPGSTAIGKGTLGFSPLSVVPVDPVFGATEITPPGADIGCYQSNGTGNQH